MSNGLITSPRTHVVIVGGGIAGAWLAYRLAQRDVPAVVISADEYLPPLSRKWAAGLMDRRVVDCSADTAADVFADISTTQDPAYRPMMVERVRKEFNDLTAMIEYQSFGAYLHPCGEFPGIQLGAGDSVVGTVLGRFADLGGRIVEGRVTDLVVDDDVCAGVRYEHDGVPGKLLGTEIVFASGGFCGLFEDGVGTSTGYLLGTYARHGGRLANLELFKRFALGDLGRKRPLYPFDLHGARLLRAGEPATELTNALDEFAGDRLDMDVFTRYWINQLDIPHTAELATGTARLGPMKGFAPGGMAPQRSRRPLSNVHATGECCYGLSVDSVTGKPFASFLAMSAQLADTLARRSTGVADTDFEVGQAAAPTDPSLRNDIARRMAAFQDNRFRAPIAAEFIGWCGQQRALRRSDTEAVDLLILAEAYTASVLVRAESRGFHYRPDFPQLDPRFDNRITLASYDADTDTVHVELAATDAGTES